MKKTKMQKGITLIALIITIVVLLILAVTAINSISGSGIIQYAKRTVKETETARKEEEIKLNIVSMNLDIYDNKDKYEITLDESATDEEIEAAIIKFYGAPLKAIREFFEVDGSFVTTIGNEEVFDYGYMKEKGLAEQIEENGNYKLIVKVPCTYKDEIELDIIVELEMSDAAGRIISFELGEIKKKDRIIVSTQKVKTPTVGENIKEVTAEGVPIPKGFYYVTGSKDTGLVISDSPDDENDSSGNNGNQFVWVPVEMNPKIEIIINEGKMIDDVTISSLKGFNETEKVNANYFEKEISVTQNDIYSILIKYADGTQEEELVYIDECYETTYDMAHIRTWMNIALVYGEAKSEDEAIEFVKNYVLNLKADANVGTKIDIIKEFENVSESENISESEKIKFKYEETNYEEKESVLKYGGFYIGRYEMASDSTIMKDKFPVLKTYAEAKLEVEKLYPDNDSVKTMLPTAAAWDATCAWLKRNEEISEVGEKELYIEAKVWGNHKEEIFADYDAKQERTGYGLNANKIYDLTGNEQEWTTETGENNYNIVRGGTFRKDIIITFYLKDEASDETAKAGCRPIMYIN